jgi:hypothetical protein
VHLEVLFKQPDRFNDRPRLSSPWRLEPMGYEYNENLDMGGAYSLDQTDTFAKHLGYGLNLRLIE